jgi:hypothetical protein
VRTRKPRDRPSSRAQTSRAPTSPTPSSRAPASGAPTSETPGSLTPNSQTPSSQVPTSLAPRGSPREAASSAREIRRGRRDRRWRVAVRARALHGHERRADRPHVWAPAAGLDQPDAAALNTFLAVQAEAQNEQPQRCVPSAYLLCRTQRDEKPQLAGLFCSRGAEIRTRDL